MNIQLLAVINFETGGEYYFKDGINFINGAFQHKFNTLQSQIKRCRKFLQNPCSCECRYNITKENISSSLGCLIVNLYTAKVIINWF